MNTPPSRTEHTASIREGQPRTRRNQIKRRPAPWMFDEHAAEPDGTPGECPGGGIPGRGENPRTRRLASRRFDRNAAETGTSPGSVLGGKPGRGVKSATALWIPKARCSVPRTSKSAAPGTRSGCACAELHPPARAPGKPQEGAREEHPHPIARHPVGQLSSGDEGGAASWTAWSRVPTSGFEADVDESRRKRGPSDSTTHIAGTMRRVLLCIHRRTGNNTGREAVGRDSFEPGANAPKKAIHSPASASDRHPPTTTRQPAARSNTERTQGFSALPVT